MTEYDLSNSLTVQQDIDILTPSTGIDLLDGSLTAGSIHLAASSLGISGDGQVTVKGELYNQGSITADYQPGAALGTVLTVDANKLVNTGLLFASAHATLEVSATHFTNYSDGALIGGSYEAQNGTLKLHTPGPITIDDASLILVMDGPGGIQSFNPASGTYVPLGSTLTTITAQGSLQIGLGDYASANGLTDYGAIDIGGGSDFQGPSLSVAASGTMTMAGATISVGQFSNNGTVTVQLGSNVISAPAITGAGTIVIGPQTSAVDLTGTVANAIKFSDGTGTVTLDTPTGMTGSFQQFQAGDQIVLSGVSLSSVTGYNYSGSASSGVLTIHEGSTSIKLDFTGDYTTANFSLSSSTHGLDIVGVA